MNTTPKPRSLTVLLPLAENTKIDWSTHTFLAELREAYADLGVEFGELVCVGLDQAQARAEVVSAWLRVDHTEDALLLDSDMSADVRLVTEQMAVLEEPLLLAPYLQRNEDGGAHGLARWTIDTAGRTMAAETREGRRMLPMPGSGLGFTRIRREALAKAFDFFNPKDFPLLNWISYLSNHAGLPVCGLFEPIVHEHLQPGVNRRRSEDVSFFLRMAQAGVTPYALLDAVVTHHGKTEGSFLDALLEDERKLLAKRRRASFELRACPDDLLGLVDVLDGAYEVSGVAFDKPPRILDLGANIGAFAVWAKQRFPGSTIDCYEPHPEHVRLLRENVSPFEGVTIHEAAVLADPPESGTIRLHDPAPGMNTGVRSVHLTPGATVEAGVDARVLAAASLPPCDYLKIDTEGCEREILEVYPLTGVSVVVCEWHSTEDYLWIKGFMRAQGFECRLDRARGRFLPDRELGFVRPEVVRRSLNGKRPFVGTAEPRA